MAFVYLGIYIILFAIGYSLKLVFDKGVSDGYIFVGYMMAALFCGLSGLSDFINDMICINGCLMILLFMIIKQAVSLAISMIALSFCVSMYLY